MFMISALTGSTADAVMMKRITNVVAASRMAAPSRWETTLAWKSMKLAV